jgi:hypothetical protein
MLTALISVCSLATVSNLGDCSVALASRPRRRRDCRVLTDDGGVLQLHFTVHAMWGGRQLQHRCVLAFR